MMLLVFGVVTKRKHLCVFFQIVTTFEKFGIPLLKRSIGYTRTSPQMMLVLPPLNGMFSLLLWFGTYGRTKTILFLRVAKLLLIVVFLPPPIIWLNLLCKTHLVVSQYALPTSELSFTILCSHNPRFVWQLRQRNIEIDNTIFFIFKFLFFLDEVTNII